MIFLYTILASSIAMAAAGWFFGGRQDDMMVDELPIDPTDSRTIGLLVGLTGGTITDAAIARAAITRFEQTYGRHATARDLAIVAGMMKTTK